MIEWVVAHVLGVGRGVADLAQRVADSFQTLWNTLAGAFGRWLIYFWLLAGRTVDLVEAVGAFVWASAGTFAWFLVTKLPHELAVLGNDIRAWVVARINDVINIAGRLINDARVAATQAIEALRRYILGQLDAIARAINDAISLLQSVAKLVFALLTSPVALADWVAGAIVQAVLRYAKARADDLARMLIGNAIRWTGAVALLIEQVIADIL